MLREIGSQFLLRQQHRNIRVLEHEGEALFGKGRIERDVGAAGFKDAEQADNHLQRSLDANPNQRLWSHSQPAQIMGQLIRPRIQLAVTQSLVVELNGNRVGSTRRLFLK